MTDFDLSPVCLNFFLHRYTEANPWLREGPKLTPPGTFAHFGSSPTGRMPETNELERIKSLKVKYVSTQMNEFYPTDTQAPLLNTGAGAAWSDAQGARVGLWSNIRMSPNITRVPCECVCAALTGLNDIIIGVTP